MSLYNLIHGTNPAAPVLLAILGINAQDVPRFRDCFVKDGKIVIHTRTGGGNRDDYVLENAALELLPGYIRNEDDDYDCTYANFYYEVPEKYRPLVADIPESEDPGVRWQKALDHIRTASPDDPQLKKITDALAPLFNALKSTDP